MILLSPAKINIGLQILKKRDDGYHDISSLMYLTPLYDIIELVLDKNGSWFSYSQSGITVPGDLESNLCYRAWELFSRKFGEISVKVHLHKVIPMGAGLGGGSSNGATVLKGLNMITGSKISSEKIYDLAAQLGSDCSIFIAGKSSMASGRGEILKDSQVDLSGFHLVLLNPGIEVNTADAYRKIVPDNTRTDLEKLLLNPVEQWKECIFNDFEQTVFKMHPEIAVLKNELYNSGAIYASMSGSGSSVFGIFKHPPHLSTDLKNLSIYSGLF